MRTEELERFFQEFGLGSEDMRQKFRRIGEPDWFGEDIRKQLFIQVTANTQDEESNA